LKWNIKVKLLGPQSKGIIKQGLIVTPFKNRDNIVSLCICPLLDITIKQSRNLIKPALGVEASHVGLTKDVAY
jgi:hypothetical protein